MEEQESGLPLHRFERTQDQPAHCSGVTTINNRTVGDTAADPAANCALNGKHADSTMQTVNGDKNAHGFIFNTRRGNGFYFYLCIETHAYMIHHTHTHTHTHTHIHSHTLTSGPGLKSITVTYTIYNGEI